MRVVGVVPAKSSSSRLPNKNNLKINDVELFINACYNLSKILPKKDIYVDTDSEHMIAISMSHGFNGFIRDKKYANNSCCGNMLMRLELERVDCDILVQHLPTMPFLTKKTLEDSIEAVVSGLDSVLVGYEDSFYQWTGDQPDYDILNIPNSFELGKTFIEGMGLYVSRRDFFEHSGVRVGGRHKKIYLNKFERTDINYKEDYDLSVAIQEYFRRNYE